MNYLPRGQGPAWNLVKDEEVDETDRRKDDYEMNDFVDHAVAKKINRSVTTYNYRAVLILSQNLSHG